MEACIEIPKEVSSQGVSVKVIFIIVPTRLINVVYSILHDYLIE